MPKEAASFKLRPWAIASAACLGLSAVALVLILLCVEEGHRGSTGDMLGGSLSWGVAGAGTILFVATLLMQRDELSLQRRELQSAMEIAREQKDIAKDQEKHSADQVTIARRDSVRRSLGQLLEVRIAMSSTYTPNTADSNVLRDRQARMIRLSQLVIHVLSSEDLAEEERQQWKEAFGPWMPVTYRGVGGECIRPPYKHPLIKEADLVDW